MPSLNPFTAFPRSAPILRSFLVPKISTTTSSTISQCQILKLPILLSFMPAARATGAVHSILDDHASERIGTAEYVKMYMIHVLPPHAAGIGDEAEPVRAAVLAREPGRQQHDLAEDGAVSVAGLGERGNMALRDHQDVYRRRGTDVVESEDFRILIHLVRRCFAANDLAKDAIFHGSPRDARE